VKHIALLTAVTGLCAHVAASALPACRATDAVPIQVLIGPATAAQVALLRGGVFPPLSIELPGTGQVLWSAAAVPPAAQSFPAMHAQFAGSLLPLDLDGDGLHDRLYAGDVAGQLWRFDLHHGAAPAAWATGGVLADLSGGAARGLLAPPDVSLASPGEVPAGGTPWFNIAVGTARIGTGFFDNRFYVLRDQAPFDVWSAADYARWRPLRDSDLVQVGRMGDPLAAPAPNGYFFSVGAGDVLAPSLTVSGRATLAMGTAAGAAANCQVAVTVAAIEIATGREHSTPATGGGNTSAPARLSVTTRAGDPFTLKVDGRGQAVCSLGGTHVAACDVNTAPKRRWWRREDAD
jgi:hypothetical protein